MGDPATAGDPEPGRLRRLREELADEQVEVPLAGDLGELLLREIAYAQRPWVHERHIPTYGALVSCWWQATPHRPRPSTTAVSTAVSATASAVTSSSTSVAAAAAGR